MKRGLIFCMLAGILFASCMDDPLESPPAVVDKPMSRFIVTNNESETNPDLISDWENQETITIMDTAKDKVIVDAPWVDQGASTSMPGEFRRNIKKKDGWIMLFHTFKLKTGTNSQNYMCFYNLFTGVINKNSRNHKYRKSNFGLRAVGWRMILLGTARGGV